MTRIFSDAELAALAASPADRMRAAFEAGDPEQLATTVTARKCDRCKWNP